MWFYLDIVSEGFDVWVEVRVVFLGRWWEQLGLKFMKIENMVDQKSWI
jgi:hypothetical protein